MGAPAVLPQTIASVALLRAFDELVGPKLRQPGIDPSTLPQLCATRARDACAHAYACQPMHASMHVYAAMHVSAAMHVYAPLDLIGLAAVRCMVSMRGPLPLGSGPPLPLLCPPWPSLRALLTQRFGDRDPPLQRCDQDGQRGWHRRKHHHPPRQERRDALG